MTSTKSAAQKRTKPLLLSDRTRAFERDWTRLDHSGRYDMNALKACMLLIVANNGLPPEYKNHLLKGDWDGYWECHVGGDFLLIYELREQYVIFHRAGTHSELFK
jgi:mRNA interferase YafQ